MINISYVVFQGDTNKYIESQTTLKAMAEECAVGAALYYNKEEYSRGRMVFNYEEGEKYIEYILDNFHKYADSNQEQLTYDLEYEDDLQGYSNENEVPSVRVILKIKTKDLYRLPFIKIEEITRSSKYELPYR